MREILFRAKNYRTKQWVYGIPFKNPLRGSEDAYYPQIIPEVNGVHSTINSCSIIEETIGQFTVLTDKNGVKIFEGDIVRYGDTIHKVVFEQRNGTAYFGLVYSPIETLPFGHYQDLRQLEVIGNIYDNPELIGGEEQ